MVMHKGLLFLWCVQIVIVGSYLMGLNFDELKDDQLLPAVIGHVVVLLAVILTKSVGWLTVVPPSLGLAVQTHWYIRQRKIGEGLLDCNISDDCRHRVEYYVSGAVVGILYVCAVTVILASEARRRDTTHGAHAKPDLVPRVEGRHDLLL